MRFLRWCFAVVFMLGLVQVASAAAPLPQKLFQILERLDNPPLPSAWYGVWNIQSQLKDCETLQIISSLAFTDTICPQDLAYSDTTFSCTGTATATAFHLTCSAHYEEEGCTVDAAVQSDGTLTGDSFSSVSIVNFAFSGEQCGFPGTFCSRDEETGTRTSTSTAGCDAPVVPLTWGKLKAVYP